MVAKRVRSWLERRATWPSATYGMADADRAALAYNF